MATGRSAQQRSAGRRRVAGERSRSRAATDAPEPQDTTAPRPDPIEQTGTPAADNAPARDGSTAADTAAARRSDTAPVDSAADTAAAPGSGTAPGSDTAPSEPAPADAEAAEPEAENAATAAVPDIEDGAEPATRRGRLPHWLPVLFAVLILLFSATAGILGQRLYQGHQREVSRGDVLHIAPSYVATVFSFDYRHLQDNASAARPLLVGTYRHDYDASMKRNAASYRRYHYVVKSTIASTGVSDASADRVRLVAFIDQTVIAGTDKPGTSRQQIRLALTFEHHGGTWLLAQVEPL